MNTCDICLENSDYTYICQHCEVRCCDICLKKYINNHSHFLPIPCFNCKENLDLSQFENQPDFINEMKKIFNDQLKNIELEYNYLIPKFLNYISNKYEISKLFKNVIIFDLYKLMYIKLYKWNYRNKKNKIKSEENDFYMFPILLKEIYNYIENPLIENYKKIKVLFKEKYYEKETIERLKIHLSCQIEIKTEQKLLYSSIDFKKIYNWNKYNIYPHNELTSFVENELMNMNEKLQKNIIQRCTECQKGIIFHDYKKDQYLCNICQSTFCQKCLHKITSNEHQCDAKDLETSKYIFENTKPCPKCGTRIEKDVGCDSMYCTYCKTGFNWKNNEIITTDFHNPHRIEDIKNKKNIPNLPEQLCSDFYILTFNLRKFEPYINTEKINDFKTIYNYSNKQSIKKYEEILMENKYKLLCQWLFIVLKSKLINTDDTFIKRIIKNNNLLNNSLIQFMDTIYNKSKIENRILLEEIYNDFIIKTEQYIILHNQVQPKFEEELNELIELKSELIF